MNSYYELSNDSNISNDISENQNMSLSELDKAVVSNNIELVKKLIQEGNTIYKSNKLCNGNFEKKGMQHPKDCCKNVCYKSCLWYGLYNNCKSVNTIIMLLLKLQELIPDFRTSCECCKNVNNNGNNIKIVLKNFGKIPCDCQQKKSFCKGYNKSFLNYKNIYDLFKNYLNAIKTDLNNITNLIYKNHTYGFLEFGDKSHNDIIFESFYLCPHAKIFSFDLIYCPKDQQQKNIDDAKKIIIHLNKLIDYYFINCSINEILFDQQAYELYNWIIKNVDNEELIISNIKQIYYDNIDIKYKFNGIDILTLTLQHKDYPNVIEHICKYYESINNNLFVYAIKKKYYKSAIILLNYVDNIININDEYVNNDSSLFMSIINNDMNVIIKLEFVKKLIDKGIDISIDKPLDFIFDLEYANRLLNIILLNKTIVNMICDKHVQWCIINKKIEILELLLNHYKSNFDFIQTYITSTNKDDDNSVNILKILVKFGYINNMNNMILLYLTQYGRLNSLSILIDNDADVNVVDNNGNTILVYAIKYNHYNIIKKFMIFDNMINKQNNDMLTPIMISLSSNDPIKILKLFNIDKINFDIIDKYGWTFQRHVLESSLSEDKKIELLNVIIHKINFEKINNRNTEPLLIIAIKKNLFEIAILIICRLYESGVINITYGDIISFRNKNFDIYFETTDKTCNFYNLIVDVIKQSYQKQISNNENKYINNEYINNDENKYINNDEYKIFAKSNKNISKKKINIYFLRYICIVLIYIAIFVYLND